MKTKKSTLTLTILMITLTQMLSSCSTNHGISTSFIQDGTIGFHVSYVLNTTGNKPKRQDKGITINGFKLVPLDFSQQNSQYEFKLDKPVQKLFLKKNPNHRFVNMFLTK